ncbi:hypothetical protein TNIN_366571 [Trichonephila inaurata madagascariensis]|uniref:Uncharacterized protein n=1 Tax=Trichonephila inaurata madagascariensis TaxID=2747483 RepID=A0A8X6M773_9ARAC|nr:hypothetical protein TNIN_366571 [Trichonephila inaurata madagascariensis]
MKKGTRNIKCGNDGRNRFPRKACEQLPLKKVNSECPSLGPKISKRCSHAENLISITTTLRRANEDARIQYIDPSDGVTT